MAEPNALEIITRLETMLAVFDGAAVAVAFADRTEFVRAGDPERLTKLTRLIGEGGRPVCFVFGHPSGEVVINPLAEVENEPGVSEYMMALGEWMRSETAKDGIAKPPRVN